MLHPSIIVVLINNEADEPRCGAWFHPEAKIVWKNNLTIQDTKTMQAHCYS
jgi:hypothetical protein